MGSFKSNRSPKEELGGSYFWNSLNLKVLLSININMIYYYYYYYYYYFHVIPKGCHAKKIKNWCMAFWKTKWLPKWSCLQVFHFWKCLVRFYAVVAYLQNTLRKILEFFLANNNSYSKNVGSSYFKNSKKQLIFKKELANNHGFLVVYYYVFYLLDD